MDKKIKRKLYYNIIMFVLIIGISVAWMITYSSRGEIVNYDRKLIVPGIVNVEISLYHYENGQYVLLDKPYLDISNLAPGSKEQFRFDIKNKNNNFTKMQIVFSKITGDIDILKDYITIASTSPHVLNYNLGRDMKSLPNGDAALYFDDNFQIDANKQISLYWYLELDSSAGNEVAEKQLYINSINFIKA